MEKKFTKYFISKVEKYGLNQEDISKNLKSFNVNWKKSNPFSIINPKYIGTISISNLQYEISLETGNNKLRFKDFRVIGAIGVLEMHDKVDVASIQKKLVDHGVWLRPFSNLIYIMPPFIISQKDLKFLINQLQIVINIEY